MGHLLKAVSTKDPAVTLCEKNHTNIDQKEDDRHPLVNTIPVDHVPFEPISPKADQKGTKEGQFLHKEIQYGKIQMFDPAAFLFLIQKQTPL